MSLFSEGKVHGAWQVGDDVLVRQDLTGLWGNADAPPRPIKMKIAKVYANGNIRLAKKDGSLIEQQFRVVKGYKYASRGQTSVWPYDEQAHLALAADWNRWNGSWHAILRLKDLTEMAMGRRNDQAVHDALNLAVAALEPALAPEPGDKPESGA